ncbi:hypothetical protein D3C75_1154750 [compost metagenome]
MSSALSPSVAVMILPLMRSVAPTSVERALESSGVSVSYTTVRILSIPNSIVSAPSTFNTKPINKNLLKIRKNVSAILLQNLRKDNEIYV